MPWPNFAPTPLPEDQEAIFVAAWIVAGLIGCHVGFRMVRRHHWLRMALTGFLLLVVIVIYSKFNNDQISTIVESGSPSGITIVIPLFSCHGSEAYLPGGTRYRQIEAQRLREIRQRPECFQSTILSDGLYLLISSTINFLLFCLLSSAVKIFMRSRKTINEIIILIREAITIFKSK